MIFRTDKSKSMTTFLFEDESFNTLITEGVATEGEYSWRVRGSIVLLAPGTKEIILLTHG